MVPRYAPTGVVSAGPSLDRHDGGNSTGRDQTTTPLGRAVIPKTDHNREPGRARSDQARTGDPTPTTRKEP